MIEPFTGIEGRGGEDIHNEEGFVSYSIRRVSAYMNQRGYGLDLIPGVLSVLGSS